VNCDGHPSCSLIFHAEASPSQDRDGLMLNRFGFRAHPGSTARQLS
jgi:hypothetical protein